MGRNSDYNNGMYQQLMEIMGRLETVEKESTQKINSLNSRIASFLNAAGNGELKLSEGSVYSFCKSFAKPSETSILNLENHLMDHVVAATDATTVTVNGKQNYIRNLSIKKLLSLDIIRRAVL